MYLCQLQTSANSISRFHFTVPGCLDDSYSIIPSYWSYLVLWSTVTSRCASSGSQSVVLGMGLSCDSETTATTATQEAYHLRNITLDGKKLMTAKGLDLHVSWKVSGRWTHYQGCPRFTLYFPHIGYKVDQFGSDSASKWTAVESPCSE